MEVYTQSGVIVDGITPSPKSSRSPTDLQHLDLPLQQFNVAKSYYGSQQF